jgi:hypothetical protein
MEDFAANLTVFPTAKICEKKSEQKVFFRRTLLERFSEKKMRAVKATVGLQWPRRPQLASLVDILWH